MENKFDGDAKDAEIFKDVAYLVQASHEEYGAFWQHFSHESPHRIYPSVCVQWQEISMGGSRCVGHIAKRPVWVEYSYAILDGKKVLFYDGMSELVDWKMIERWISHCIDKYMGGGRPHSNAANFHNCLGFIREKK